MDTPGPLVINLNVDVDKLVSDTWEKALALFGKDETSEQLKSWIDDRTRCSFLQCREVQCVGMREPLLISDIYQPTRLVRDLPETVKSQVWSRTAGVPQRSREWSARIPEEVPATELLQPVQNLVITAGPGWGKTTLLHWLFLHLLLRSGTKALPFLITLRQNDAIEDLETIVAKTKSIQKRNDGRKVMLLVDGYDEISTESRKKVSNLLLKFCALDAGGYYLTCRDYYEIFELKARRLRIADFSDEDQIRFISAFLRAYGSSVDGEQVISELQRRGIGDLIRHPLLLTLAAITVSARSNLRVRNVVSLIESALSTLSLRWDQSKGLTREPTTPLDGAARIKLLKRLAYTLELEPVAEHRAVNIVAKQLELMRWDNVEPLNVLLEMARFYGIFAPVGDRWGFVHKSLQDYLAAKQWVETGAFVNSLEAGPIKFDSRMAFAGCLVEDATAVMETALGHRDGLPVFVEMLTNDPSFKHAPIALAIIRYYEKYRGEHYYWKGDNKIECAFEEEFVTVASSKFLEYIVQECARIRARITDTIAAYAIFELNKRRVPLGRLVYDSCVKAYGENVSFDVRNRGIVRLKDIRHN